jgi:hypothetical protein
MSIFLLLDGGKLFTTKYLITILVKKLKHLTNVAG